MKGKSICNYIISKEDKHQLLLYTQWPKFMYRRTGAKLNGKKRSITHKTVTPGTQYLLICDCCPQRFCCAMPSNVLVASNCLALQIINFIEFQTGRPFVRDEPRDSWSQMIWNLLDVSFHSIFNKKQAGYCNTPRGTDGIADFLNLMRNHDNISSPDGIRIPIICIQSVLTMKKGA